MNNTDVTGTWNPGDNMFTGKWVNRNTGERITIINNLIDENNQMILITSIGQLSMDEFSNNYIQDVDEYNDVIEQPVQTTPNNYDNYLLECDKNILDKKITNNTKINNSNNSVDAQNKENQKNNILEKFFNDNKNISCDINLNFDFNINELKTIMKYTDVTTDDICEYIYENIINKENLKKEIGKLFLNLDN